MSRVRTLQSRDYASFQSPPYLEERTDSQTTVYALYQIFAFYWKK